MEGKNTTEKCPQLKRRKVSFIVAVNRKGGKNRDRKREKTEFESEA